MLFRSREINEINALVHHGGKLYAGVIPRSELYRHDEDGRWQRLAQLGQRSDWSEPDYETWLRLTALASFVQGQQATNAAVQDLAEVIRRRQNLTRAQPPTDDRPGGR